MLWVGRQGCIKRIIIDSNDGSVLRVSRSVLVVVVVLIIDLFARVFDYEDDDGRVLVKAARDLGGIC